MTILLQHSITEKPKKSSYIWIKSEPDHIYKIWYSIGDAKAWDKNTSHCICWYEEITLPDDTIIVQ